MRLAQQQILLQNITEELDGPENYIIFKTGLHQPPRGKTKAACGLVLAWKINPKVTIQDFSNYHISAIIFPSYGDPWLFMGYYGSPYTTPEEILSWKMIENTDEAIHLPWLIMGDLNFVLHEHEKYSQHPIDNCEADIFLNKIEAANLTDLGYTKCPFTWTNRRNGIHLTEQRLDKGLANESWLDLYPNSTISDLAAIGSDHNPILLNTNPSWTPGHIPFKFFGPWLDHKYYKTIIEECWKTNHKGSLAIKIYRKLRDVKITLKRWNKEVYGNIHTNLEDST
ncbi:uncharacterized protein LOC113292854 [Papaver somniferum]|uniref:uncharacterized protein LOC113292854 n=1 Tax=Papaver somniferum TaxID=3469 RepID=UPI000E6FE5EE|nr:uncharacterized protein LOC113292854 [Papaver somniferum]